MTGRRPPLSRPLSDRDRQIVQSVAAYRVLSGDHIRRWHFPVLEHGSPAGALRRSQRSLHRLVVDGVLATLERRVGGVRAGSSGYCYVLGYRGQKLICPTRRARSAYTLGDRFVAHALAVADIHVGLIEAEREGSVEVLGLQPEPDAWRRYVAASGSVEVLKPDLFAAVGVADRELRWFIEVDRATESLVRIERKCRQYLTYLRTGREQELHSVFPRVLWTVPHDKRRQQLLGVMARLPPPADRLFAVTLHDHVINQLKGGAP
jgi:hypothetical protein